MIEVQKIEIQNFRSFKINNIFQQLRSINVVVGRNNVGKTNILRAIYLFFNPNSYDIPTDRNMIKQMTSGQSKDPKITLTILDDEIIPGNTETYSIICDLNDKNEDKEYYSIGKSPKHSNLINIKLDTSKKIEAYIKKKIKCVYLSTTDEDIEKQTNTLIDDLILEYYKKQNRAIKKTVEQFEKQYDELIKTFQANIGSIEDDLEKQFIDMSDIGVKPKLSINPSREITSFLLDNIKMQLDDTYVQDVGSKGAGIQRASLIMLSMYLLNQIYTKTNKIILLDEPEAFLYPLLIRKIKSTLEKNAIDNNLQIFITSHAREFLTEINNEDYSFAYLEQKSEEKEYKRSKNGVETNKYSVIESLDTNNTYLVLKNYGLLEDVNDYRFVIVCEGETDSNYIQKILKDKPHIPQIRFDKYAVNSSSENKVVDLKYDMMGKATEAIPRILMYLHKISSVPRKVFVLLDGDEAGKNAAKKIRKEEFHGWDLCIETLDEGKEIEDELFSTETFVDCVLEVTPELKPYSASFRSSIVGKKANVCLIDQMKIFLQANNISISEYKIKSELSKKADVNKLEKERLLGLFETFFYD